MAGSSLRGAGLAGAALVLPRHLARGRRAESHEDAHAGDELGPHAWGARMTPLHYARTGNGGPRDTASPTRRGVASSGAPPALPAPGVWAWACLQFSLDRCGAFYRPARHAAAATASPHTPGLAKGALARRLQDLIAKKKSNAGAQNFADAGARAHGS